MLLGTDLVCCGIYERLVKITKSVLFSMNVVCFTHILNVMTLSEQLQMNKMSLSDRTSVHLQLTVSKEHNKQNRIQTDLLSTSQFTFLIKVDFQYLSVLLAQVMIVSYLPSLVLAGRVIPQQDKDKQRINLVL